MSELKIEEIVVGEGDEGRTETGFPFITPAASRTGRSLIRASTAANRLSFPWEAAW